MQSVDIYKNLVQNNNHQVIVIAPGVAPAQKDDKKMQKLERDARKAQRRK